MNFGPEPMGLFQAAVTVVLCVGGSIILGAFERRWWVQLIWAACALTNVAIIVIRGISL